MKNCITNFSKMGIVLLLIGVFGVVNVIGDIVTIGEMITSILAITQPFDDNAFFSFFFQIFADKKLFLLPEH
ncbi:MAG: hypothetical protein Ta2A_10490 [Treponemataceae bacterium]|nr:MAG: hypothetical protein Ta2A_10490 [Treponemataceae bacterium]